MLWHFSLIVVDFDSWIYLYVLLLIKFLCSWLYWGWKINLPLILCPILYSYLFAHFLQHLHGTLHIWLTSCYHLWCLISLCIFRSILKWYLHYHWFYFHSHLPFRFQLTFLNDHTLHLAIYLRAALLAAIFFSFLFTVFWIMTWIFISVKFSFDKLYK